MGLAETVVLGLMESSINSRLDTQNALLAEQNELMKRDMVTPAYDWSDPAFKGETAKIKDAFYARHPEINRPANEFSILFPNKVKAIHILNRLSELNRIHPDEFLVLFREIFNF